MASYWIRASYLSCNLSEEQRRGVVSAAIDNCQGKLLGFWLAELGLDGVAIFELPDDIPLQDFMEHLCEEGACGAVESIRLLRPPAALVP